jgi:hypothetical protein
MGFDSKQTAAAHTGPARTERMMRAIVQDSYGSADVLRSAPTTRFLCGCTRPVWTGGRGT